MELTGTLSGLGQLTGTLHPVSSLTGQITNGTIDLSGSTVTPLQALSGLLSSPQNLTGAISPEKRKLSGSLSKVIDMTGKLSNATLRGLSAYEIAVIYTDYEGTEEEWIASLHGDKMEIRNNDGIIEYKYETQSLWTVLIDLNKYTNDYEKLINKPKIDGTTLIGDRDLSIDYLRNDRALTNFEIEELLT